LKYRIYVAAPYSAPTEAERLENVRRACQAGALLIAKGHVPFIPHLSHYTDEIARALGIEIPYEEWMTQDEHWLLLCDALLYLAPSPGADRELHTSQWLGKTIFRSVAEVPSA
jgi:hypothetical protein